MNTKTNKEIIDAYFSENYQMLDKYCSTLVNKVHKSELTSTLITSAYLYIIENEDKFTEVIQSGKLGGHVKNYVTKQIVWQGTKFKKEFVYEDTMPFEDEESDDDDTYLDKRNFVMPDEDEEMYEREFEHQSKLSHVEYKYQQLDVPSRILYNISIVGPYNSGGKLSKYLGINRNSTYHLRKNLLNFLREGYVPPQPQY